MMEQFETAPVVLSISVPTSNNNCKSSSIAETTGKSLNTASSVVVELPRARGLTNLGNTCFFNACMQCLGQTPFLTTILNDGVVHLPGGEFKSEDGTTIMLPPIKIEYTLKMDDMLQLFRETMVQLQASGSVYNPSPFFRKFTAQHPQFGGGDQHDSHELLRHLLDSVLVSEKKIYHEQLLDSLLNGRKLKPEEKIKLEWYANQSKDRYLIRRVFQGSLESTLRCEDCGNTSPNTEKFLDISLPVSQIRYGGASSSSMRPTKNTSPERPTKRELRKEKRATKRERVQGASDGTTAKEKSDETSDVESGDESSDDSTLIEQRDEEQQDTSNNNVNELEMSETFGTFRLSATGVTELLRKHAVRSSGEHCRTIGEPYVNPRNECNVQSCLNAFVASELLSGNNKVTCEACTRRINGPDPKAKSVLTNATKQFLVSSLPAVLILHLKRFQMGLRHSFLKLSTEINFPLILDMGPFCAASPQTVKQHRTVHRDQKHILYSLYGIVEHSGTMHTGHYIAYVRVRPKIQAGDPRWRFVSKLYNEKSRDAAAGTTNGHGGNHGSSSDSDESDEKMGQTTDRIDDVRPPGKWYQISDSRVVETTEDRVLSAQAYLLFYERIF